MTQMTSTVKTLSLRDAGIFDKDRNLKAKITGWGAISKKRHHADSSTQTRKRNRKAKKGA